MKILKIGINKTAKYVTSKLICNFLIPGTIESYEMFKQNHDATCNIDQNIRLYIKNNNLEKTLGFALHYNKVDNRVEIFSLEQNQLSSQLFSGLNEKIIGNNRKL
ncbi:hypothetical protein ACOES3_03080 [Candidatus Phytoplasma citri]